MKTAVHWDEEQIRLIAERELGGCRLMVVSDSEPYIHQGGPGQRAELKRTAASYYLIKPARVIDFFSWLAYQTEKVGEN